MDNSCGGDCSEKQCFSLPMKRNMDSMWNCTCKRNCDCKQNDGEDCISRLPDDLLACILSHLTMKEAAQSSVLSTRWIHLWTLFTGSLDFDYLKTLREIDWGRERRSLDIERAKFTSWVNQVLKSHQAPTIDELRICFDIDSKSDIDNWINFALAKRVKKLELNLARSLLYRSNKKRYAIPSNLISYTSLIVLRLESLDVTEQDLEFILSNNQLLEVLSVHDSKCLVRFKVFGASLKLKHLEISRCLNLEDLEISAGNLVAFHYCGREIANPFKNVPRLTECSFGGFYCFYIVDNFCQIPSCLALLQKLVLIFGGASVDKEFPQGIAPLLNLKHLELVISVPETEHCLFSLTSLLKASPSLYRLALKITHVINSSSSREIRKMKIEHPFESLKVVEVVGFAGVAADTEFVLCLLENAVALEKLIINPCRASACGRWLDLKFQETEQFRRAKRCAVELGDKVPPRLEYVVL